ncbi:DUF2071 domain-containing protein [Mariniblastus fucicola]|uniref:Uncharacterized protein n=1 Tax=Mariniblastus fucicola TaxID=980251 RepID=A0A5B9PG22_9BACT|nr:DUF2071 domain-containing protein [Mariniblastus fucicola]QEG23536.1 hypothetical protein MFFC18_34370 [Mariniblastus fucicola]
MQSTNHGQTDAVNSASASRLSRRSHRVDSDSTIAVPPNSARANFTARFSEMVLINFEADKRLLKKIVPKGLEPDLYQGSAHISLVAKRIRNLKCCGFPISRDFASVGLQLYVREPHLGSYRYGTFFLKHYVQRSIAAWIMSRLTQSEVLQMPMKLQTSKLPVNRPPDIEYQWKVRDRWNDIRIRGRSRVKDIRPGSKIEFILRHADRYVVNEKGVWRSELTTPEWVIWDVAQAKFDCDVERLFGSQFVKAMSHRPASVFLSRGNEVSLSRPELVEPV